jgi:hypothetical protein
MPVKKNNNTCYSVYSEVFTKQENAWFVRKFGCILLLSKNLGLIIC